MSSIRKSTTILTILNNELGRCKYLYRSDMENMGSYLRRFKYVRDNNFTDEEINWHVDKFLKIKFGKGL